MSTISAILPQPEDNFSTQIASATVASTDLSIELDDATGLATEGVGQLFKKDANGDIIAGSIEFCHWTNVSGNTLTFSDTGDRGITGSDSGAQAYVADDYFEVWVSSYYNANDILDNAFTPSTGAVDTTKVTDLTTAQVLTNKNLSSATNTLPTSAVTLTGTQTLTNKDLSSATNTLPTSAVTLTGTQTLTNKRITPRVVTAASYTTDTGSSLNCDTTDIFIVTAQAGALKFNNPTGTPTDGQKLWLAVTGTAARALTYDTQFEASAGAPLPTTTVTTARLDIGFVWRVDTSKWHCVASA